MWAASHPVRIAPDIWLLQEICSRTFTLRAHKLPQMGAIPQLIFEQVAAMSHPIRAFFVPAVWAAI